MIRRLRTRQPDFPLFDHDPFCSIILVTYNIAEDMIARCLQALRALDYPSFETIIVDNASHQETQEALGRLCGDEIVIWNKTNRGFCGGCNDGAKRAKGEVLVFLNVDTEARSDWLRELVRPFRENPRAAVTGCKMYYPGGRKLQHAGAILHANAMTEHYAYQQEDAGQADEERSVDWCTGAALAVRREFIERSGGDAFDESFFPAYYEDVDLCYRARLMGYETIYVPRAVLVHFESPVIPNTSRRFYRLCYRSRIIFCLKNYTLRQWLFEWLPLECNWLRAPYSKGFRKKQLRAYLDGLLFLLGRRLDPQSLPDE
ncbi:glycosyltransferase family 2 protein [Candidatus Sumerlaeota bacterium]|nr:glycosyltransferase family 2 protein [Candidatus Sumerlaeota bacterium]